MVYRDDESGEGGVLGGAEGDPPVAESGVSKESVLEEDPFREVHS